MYTYTLVTMSESNRPITFMEKASTIDGLLTSLSTGGDLDGTYRIEVDVSGKTLGVISFEIRPTDQDSIKVLCIDPTELPVVFNEHGTVLSSGHDRALITVPTPLFPEAVVRTISLYRKKDFDAAADEPDTESNKEQKYLYVLLTDTGTTFGRLIKHVTKSPYSHASLALDEDLSRLYSYNLNVNGFSRESRADYIGCKYTLYRSAVSDEQYAKVEDYINMLQSCTEETEYSFRSVINALFKRNVLETERGRSAICSEFVGNVFAEVNIKLFRHNRSAIQPYEIVKSRKMEHVRRGIMRPISPI